MVILNLKKFLNDHKKEINIAGKTIIIGGAELIKIYNPNTAIPIEMLKQIFPALTEFQLQQILGGLKESENEEMRINQLYAYSQNIEGKLILFKLVDQALNSSSTKALVILGVMLSDCMKENKNPSYEDVIVMSALKTASDYEIKYIKEIYDQYIDEGYIDEKRLNKSEYAKEYNKTIEWGQANRIISKKGHRRYEEDDIDIFGEFFVVDECTEKLLYYINKAKQVLDYGNIKV